MSKFQMTPITGLPQVDGWAQVISHPSSSLFCVLAVEGQNANSVGRNLAELLISKNIKTSAELHHLLLDLLQDARTELCKIQLACLVFAENSKVIAATHNGSVFLKRNNKIGEILNSSGDLKIIEGNLQTGDLFSIVTEKAKYNFSDLKELLQQPVEKLVTELVPELQEKDNSSLIALGFLEEIATEQPVETKSNQKIDRQMLNKKMSLLKEKLKNLNLRRVVNFSKKAFKKPEIFSERIELEQNKNLQLFLKLAFLLITIFVGVIFWKQQTIQKELEPISEILANIDQRFEALKNSSNGNNTELRNEARNLLKELEDLITQNKDKKYSLEEIKKHYQEIQAFSESVSGVENQGLLEPFFDLRLSEPEFVAQKISLNDNKLFALDASGTYGIYFQLNDKKTTRVSLAESKTNIKNISLSEDYLFALGGGIHSFALTDFEKYSQLKEEGDSDRAGTLMQTYGSYIYILNPEKRNIYRYSLKDSELSEPIGWLLDKQNLDFTSIESIAIDGDLWLTDKTGNIFKYTQGQKQEFSPKDLPTKFGKSIKIATAEENNYLYILDKENKKVVIMQKDGLFVKEINSDSLSAADNIVALEEKDGALIISGSLIYEILP